MKKLITISLLLNLIFCAEIQLINGTNLNGKIISSTDDIIELKVSYSQEPLLIERKNILNIIYDNFNGLLRPNWSYDNPKDPYKAGLLSILFPSGGHYYNEEYVKGVILFASTIFTLGIGIGFNKPDREPEIGGIFLLSSSIIHYLSTKNAIKSSQKINELYYKEYLNKQNVQPTN